jgi:hypothetical protein
MGKGQEGVKVGGMDMKGVRKSEGRNPKTEGRP